jgi:hypothetical protein
MERETWLVPIEDLGEHPSVTNMPKLDGETRAAGETASWIQVSSFEIVSAFSWTQA